MKNENKEHYTKFKTKEIKFTNTNKEDVKMINVCGASKYNHSGHYVNNTCKYKYYKVIRNR